MSSENPAALLPAICQKCATPMTPLKKTGSFTDLMTITGFRCEKCDYWNNLKPRKKRAARSQTPPQK